MCFLTCLISLQEGQQVEAFMRCTVQPNLRGGKIHYAPTALTDAPNGRRAIETSCLWSMFFGPTEWAKQLSPCHMFGMVQLKVEPPAIVKGLKPKLHWVSWTKFRKGFLLQIGLVWRCEGGPMLTTFLASAAKSYTMSYHATSGPGNTQHGTIFSECCLRRSRAERPSVSASLVKITAAEAITLYTKQINKNMQTREFKSSKGPRDKKGRVIPVAVKHPEAKQGPRSIYPWLEKAKKECWPRQSREVFDCIPWKPRSHEKTQESQQRESSNLWHSFVYFFLSYPFQRKLHHLKLWKKTSPPLFSIKP